MRTHRAAAREVARWNQRLEPLSRELPTEPARAGLWERIEQEALGGAAPAPSQARPTVAKPSVRPAGPLALVARWFDSLLAPAPAAALAFGMVFGVGLPLATGWLQPVPQMDTELPESYVGVLATAQGQQGLIISSLRKGKVLDVKRVNAVPVPEGQRLYLWALDAKGQPSPIGPLPQGAFERVALPQEAESLFSKAVELAVSLEPATGPAATPGLPSGPYVYRGLCGKLWRAPAAGPAASAAR
jgi:anti-sigma-K factor RskA